jgi:electron transfer flavoprotein beta subunit
MNIVVCVKQVPDTWSEKKLDPSDSTLDRAATDPVMNEMDEYAVEEALKIQEAQGGEVTILCMGPDAASETVRKALSMGADKAILIGNVLFMTLLFAAAAGVVAKRNLKVANGLIVFLVVLAGAAALRRPDASFGDVLPSVVAAVLGPVILTVLARALRTRGADAANPSSSAPGSSRRGFLIGSGVVTDDEDMIRPAIPAVERDHR